MLPGGRRIICSIYLTPVYWVESVWCYLDLAQHIMTAGKDPKWSTAVDGDLSWSVMIWPICGWLIVPHFSIPLGLSKGLPGTWYQVHNSKEYKSKWLKTLLLHTSDRSDPLFFMDIDLSGQIYCWGFFWKGRGKNHLDCYEIEKLFGNLIFWKLDVITSIARADVRGVQFFFSWFMLHDLRDVHLVSCCDHVRVAPDSCAFTTSPYISSSPASPSLSPTVPRP